ncbi:MAG: S41 family peptidase [Oscillospiraceae bacterium]|nr:S41 family peptidase [Oscillospiraceae bacterium]
MKKRFNLATVLALMLLVCVSTYLMTRQSARWSMNQNLDYMKQIEQETARFREVRDIILDSFIGESEADMLIEGALAGMVGALGDPWSAYWDAETYARIQADDADYVGIGVGVAPESDGGSLLISEVYASSPAAEKGLRPGDEIVAVDGVTVRELGRSEAFRRIQGEEYTAVTLTVRRDGEETDHAIIRRQVTRPLVFSEIVEDDIGYIRVQKFETRVNADFEEAVKRLQQANVKGLVIDMRDNPGGNLDVMCAMLDLLLPKGRLVTIEQKDGTQEHKESFASFVDLPMVVLIDAHSYSAAEFFAACMSEYDADGQMRAKTVGEPTTGKGYAQRDITLTGGGALHLSVLRYYTPHGVSLAGVGLTPDYPVRLNDSERMSSISYFSLDRQTEKALEVLREMIGV